MKNKQLPVLVKLLIFVAIFAILGYLFFMYKDILF